MNDFKKFGFGSRSFPKNLSFKTQDAKYNSRFGLRNLCPKP
jgi:hypothetical protein